VPGVGNFKAFIVELMKPSIGVGRTD
jgi:hypothetical protein